MGPLFFRAENASKTRFCRACRCFNGAALFQSGERASSLYLVRLRVELQWGRSFSERRTVLISHRREPPADASMGPLFFRAENAYRLEARQFHQTASMGPLFFRAENSTGMSPMASSSAALQWGRSFSERRTRHGSHRPAEHARFNGAALFQSGERARGGRRRAIEKRFNGAALFQSGEPQLIY